MTMLTNVLLFQLGWFACVLGAAHGYAAGGVLVALTVVAWHVLRAARPRTELMLVLAAALLGGAWDSLLVALGWVRYAAEAWTAPLAPPWIFALWMVFATTLNVSLRWLKQRPALAVVLGAAGGPLAYFAGERLGALEMPDISLALAAQAIGWAILLPLLARTSQRLDGMSCNSREAASCLS